MHGFVMVCTTEDMEYRCKKRLRKVPVLTEPIMFYGEEGCVLHLPIGKEQLEQMEEKEVKEFLYKVLDDHDIQYAYVEPFLKKYIQTTDYSYLMKFLLFSELFDCVLAKSNLAMKDVRLIVIDSMDSKVQFVLETLVEKLNYLTILTERGPYFERFANCIYQETGLLVDVIEGPIDDVLDGNVVIDMNTTSYHLYQYLEPDAVVIDMTNSLLKRQYLARKRRRPKLVDVMEICYGTKTVNEELASLVLCSANWNLSQFVNCSDYCFSKEEMAAYKKMYGFWIKNVRIE